MPRAKKDGQEDAARPKAPGPGHSVTSPTRSFLPAYTAASTHGGIPPATTGPTNGASTPNT